MNKQLLNGLAILLMSYALPCFAESIMIFGNAKKAPKVYLEGDQPEGILIDIMKYADERLPQNFTYQLYPWKRAYKNTIDAKGGVIGLSMNKERIKIFDYSEAMYYEELLLVVMQGKEFSFTELKDLKGKIIGSLRGASWGEEFERLKAEGLYKIQEDNSARQRLLKLLSGRIDVAIIGPGRTAIDSTLKSDPRLVKAKNKFVVLPKPFKRDPNYLGFSKTMNQKVFLQEFNKIIRQANESGDLQKIIDKKRP